ncbi:hypothetical protein Ahy_A10g048458 [Arachis hypogaea]|uniref:DUF223 domain-containing protein n=1 Tax=Arachis hypogaea TaxID=3818 RepID=A0A445B560_ARAHY|nr:hypothetical protein Ahy_A10g048458 [Arachis hypogaea]
MFLSQGAVYIFAYFGFNNNCVLYHTRSHHFLLFFQAKTTVLPSFCDAIPLYDVVGVLTDVEGERKYVKDRKFIDMLVIYIENDSLKLNVVILGEMVDQIKGFVATACAVERPCSTCLLSEKPAYVAKNKVLYSTERKKIKELRAAANVEFYVVLATVLDVEPVPKANLDTYFCDGCNKDVNNVVDRYKLDLLVFDGTVTTTFENGEATDFKEFFLDKKFLFKRDTQGPVKSGVPPVGPVIHFAGDDFLILERKRSIEQLKLSKEVIGRRFAIYCVLATGLEVIDHGDWWIPACKCGKAIMIIEAASYCGIMGALMWQFRSGMIDQSPDFAQLLRKGIIIKVLSNNRDNLNVEVNFKVTDFCSNEWIVNKFKSIQLPVNPVQPQSEDGCSVCDELPDPISLLDEFNMSNALSIKKKH